MAFQNDSFQNDSFQILVQTVSGGGLGPSEKPYEYEVKEYDYYKELYLKSIMEKRLAKNFKIISNIEKIGYIKRQLISKLEKDYKFSINNISKVEREYNTKYLLITFLEKQMSNYGISFNLSSINLTEDTLMVINKAFNKKKEIDDNSNDTLSIEQIVDIIDEIENS